MAECFDLELRKTWSAGYGDAVVNPMSAWLVLPVAAMDGWRKKKSSHETEAWNYASKNTELWKHNRVKLHSSSMEAT